VLNVCGLRAREREGVRAVLVEVPWGWWVRSNHHCL